MQKISDTISRKFINTFDINDWEVETDTGWQSINSIGKTIEYIEYCLTTVDGVSLICADDHIVFDEYMNEVFVKDLCAGDKIQTINGVLLVDSCLELESSSNMYDLSVTSNDQRYYTNGILSHNSTIIAGYYAWFALFTDSTVSAILANKLAVAKEIFSRVQFIIENCPKWLQQGVEEWNKTSLKLENGSRIFCSATSPSAVRGFSCVSGDTLVTIQTDSGCIYTIPIDQVSKIASEENNMSKKFYIVYKITNLLNDKIYVGYHSTNKLDDGYMGSGSLITKAIEKYGISNFKKEILYIFNNKEEAELVEALIVDDTFVNRSDDYNITTGGNVTTLLGNKNGFYLSLARKPNDL